MVLLAMKYGGQGVKVRAKRWKQELRLEQDHWRWHSAAGSAIAPFDVRQYWWMRNSAISHGIQRLGGKKRGLGGRSGSWDQDRAAGGSTVALGVQ